MRLIPIEPGTAFGRWTTLGESERGADGRLYVRCRCQCGVERLLLKASLTRGLSRSCGCLGREIASAAHTKHRPIAVGSTFGHLTVVGDAPPVNRKRCVLCRCACGTECVKDIYVLLTGVVRSCGCGSWAPNLRHGHAAFDTASPEYRSWRSMIDRCSNPKMPNWQYYGGRGIRVCDAWRTSFEQFLAHLGPRPAGHTLDRIDSDGHYEPGNVRWSTPQQQARNRRRPERRAPLAS